MRHGKLSNTQRAIAAQPMPQPGSTWMHRAGKKTYIRIPALGRPVMRRAHPARLDPDYRPLYDPASGNPATRSKQRAKVKAARRANVKRMQRART